jgi:hypothetical protein
VSEPQSQDEVTQLRIVPDPNAVAPAPVYSNNIQGTFTPEDFTLHFGWYAIPALIEPPKPGQPIDALVKPVVRVVIPLNLMRSLIALLQRQLAAYEQSFGEISEHPNKPDWLKEFEAQAGAGTSE